MAARSAARLLAAVGPLSTEVLQHALARSRRWRAGGQSDEALAAQLVAIGAARTPDQRWVVPLDGPFRIATGLS